MKKDIHSKDYRWVVFEDSSCNYSFLTRSTDKTDKSVKWESEGQETKRQFSYCINREDVENAILLGP